jgi:hypothetical protein
MPSSESAADQRQVDESLRKMRTAVLCRLALRRGWSVDEDRVQPWVQCYEDVEVWRRIELTYGKGWKCLMKRLWHWRINQ